MNAIHNDPDYFPELRLVTLKKNIEMLVSDPKCPSNYLIERIIIHQGLDKSRYVLVVEVPTISTEDLRYSDYIELLNHWAGSLSFLVSESFSEVYQREPIHTFWDDWDIWVWPPDDDLPADFILEKYCWLLYQRELKNNDTSATEHGQRKLRPSQLHRLECRKVAKKLWAENPERTIADVIQSEEICRALAGKKYTSKTLRNWIKDLCPNRSPGRRPKKKI